MVRAYMNNRRRIKLAGLRARRHTLAALIKGCSTVPQYYVDELILADQRIAELEYKLRGAAQ